MAEFRKAFSLGRLFRWGVLGSLLVFVVRGQVLPMVHPTAKSAMVSGRVWRLTTPISGVVSRAARKGAAIHAGDVLGVVDDVRAEVGRAGDLERRAGELTALLRRLRAERVVTQSVLARRNRDLERRRDFAAKKADADMTASSLRAESAKEAKILAERRAEMIRSLSRRGAASPFEISEAFHQAAIAEHEAASHKIHLEPLHHLASVPDGPSLTVAPELYARLDELELKIAALDAQIDETEAVAVVVNQDLGRERALVARLESATLTAPATGVVLNVSRGDGELVRPGDMILEVLDDRRHVEALFPGRYAALPRGTRAKVLLPNAAAQLDGRVVLVHPYRAPDSTEAAPPSVADPDDLVRVTIELDVVPALAAVGLPVDVMIMAEDKSSWLARACVLLRSIRF